MTDRHFLDTNVLVYADDLSAGPKRVRAQEVLEAALVTNRGVLSTQVLQEYFAVATGKLGVSSEHAERRIELVSRLHVVVIRVEVIRAAIELHRLKGLSIWDALIVRAAVAGRCVRLVTEDLQHGQILAGVRVENPFLTA